MAAWREVLLVEDDDLLSSMLETCLEAAGFAVARAASLATMADRLSSRRFDLIVLDLGLPDGDALGFLSRQRPPIPVICITANQSVDVRVAALEGVAIDFLVKPFDERELVARMRNALREEPASQAVAFAGFLYHLATGRLEAAQDRCVMLTTTEARLLRAFVANPRQPLARPWLAQSAFNRQVSSDGRLVDVGVGRLRRKLGGEGATLIRSVRYVGYLFDADVTPVGRQPMLA